MRSLVGRFLIATIVASSAAGGHAAAVPSLGPEFMVSSPGAVAGAPRLARSGRRLLAVWFNPVTSAVEATLDGVPIEVSTSPNVGFLNLAVAAGPDVFLVVWTDFSRVMAVRVRAVDGIVLDHDPIVVAADAPLNARIATEIDVKFDGSEFLIAWSGPSLNLGKLRADGSVERLQGIPLSLTGGIAHLEDLIWTGQEFLLPYSLEYILPADPLVKGKAFIGLTRLSRDGSEIAASKTLIDTEVGYGYVKASAASSGNRLTHVWAGTYEPSVWMAQTTLDGRIISAPRPIYAQQTEPGYVLPPQVVWNGSEFVIFWVESDDLVEGLWSDWTVRGMRVASNSEPIDIEPFDLTHDAVQSGGPLGAIAMPGGVLVTYAKALFGGSQSFARAYARFLAATTPPPSRRRGVLH